MAVLRGMSGEVEGVVVDLTELETTVGRHDSNTYSLDHLSVSAFHCCIVKDGEKYTLQDLDSTNGTRVDSQKVGVRRLSSGNMIHIGAVEFMFEGGSGAPEGVAPVTAKMSKVNKGVTPARADTASTHAGFKTSGRFSGKTVWIVLTVVGVVVLIGVAVLFVTLLKLG